MPQPSDHEIEVFNVALELPAAERAAYLDQACAGDAALRQRIEELLKASAASCACLENPATVQPGTGQTIRLELPPSEKAGDKIGRYKLLQQIGEGGCGVVYMAEQEQPVKRRIALKVIKLGMDTKSVIARFEAERQALALMDHPNIAKVLDAGATDAGRPYFVMELVRGIKITDYCDQNNLSTEDRLRLFIQVCQAIQHAHQKGIIHRDIKPSNILVTDHDGVPVPKIIDFGIAKATTDQRLTDKTLFTAFEQFIGTPAYMSPEQARLSGLDIDTRSDIYSLGVLLYELLTGKTPFDAKELLEAGLDEMRRRIREQEPARPSTRLSTMMAADLTTVAGHRQAQPPKLINLVRGDLDWIVMKALEKDRTRRYETANGFAADIQRHLNNEPVIACPPGNLYKFQKLVRRNKLAFAAVGAVAGALVLGLAVATWQFVEKSRAEREQNRLRLQAEAEKQTAQTEAAKSRQVAQFLEDMLQGVGPSVALGRDTTLLREILDKTAERMGHDLKAQPEVEADLRSNIAQVYFALGQFEKAEMMHREALKIRRKLFGNEHPLVAASLYDLSDALMRQYDKPEKQAEAETILREALAIQRKIQGNESQDVARSLNNLAFLLVHDGKLAEGETLFRQALAMRRKLLGNGHSDVAWSLQGLCEVLFVEGRPVEAEPLAREALIIRQKLYGGEHPDVASSLYYLARALDAEGKPAEAESLYREALDMCRKLLGSEHPETVDITRSLEDLLKSENKLAAVEALYREALAGQRAALGNDSPAMAETLVNLADNLRSEGKQAEAEQVSREALEIALKSNWRDLTRKPSLVVQQAQILSAAGRMEEAERLYTGAIEAEGQNEESSSYLADLLHSYAKFLAYQENKPGAGVGQYLKELSIRRANTNDDLTYALRELGDSLLLSGNPKDAELSLREALSVYRKLHQQDDLYATGWTSERLADALYQQHKLPEAEQTYRDAVTVYMKLGAVGNEHFAGVVGSLLDLLKDENKLAEGEALFREVLAQQQAAFTNGNSAVAETLIKLADNLSGQGHEAEAEMALRTALSIMQQSVGQNPVHSSENLMRLGHLEWKLGQLLMNGQQPGEAEQLFLQALQVFETASKTFPGEPFLRQEQAYSHRLLGDLMASSERWNEAVRHYRAAVDLYAALAAGNPKSAFYLAEEAYNGSTLASVLDHAGRPDQAVEELRRAADLDHQGTESFPDEDLFQQRAPALFLQRATSVRINLADLLVRMKRYDEAEKTVRAALALSTKLGAVGSEDYAAVVRSLRDVLMAENKPVEVEEMYQEVLAAQRSMLGNDSPTVAITLSELASFLQSQNRPGEAAQKYRESMEIILKPPLNEHLFFELSSAVVPELMKYGEKQQATNICRMVLNSTATNAVWFNNVSWFLATTENVSNRDPALAVELAERAMKINPQGDWNTVGVAYYRAGDFKQALAELRKSEQRAQGDDNSYDTFFLAMAEHQVGNADAARRYYAHAIQWMDEHGPQNPELLRFRAEAEHLLGQAAKAETENQLPTPPTVK